MIDKALEMVLRLGIGAASSHFGSFLDRTSSGINDNRLNTSNSGVMDDSILFHIDNRRARTPKNEAPPSNNSHQNPLTPPESERASPESAQIESGSENTNESPKVNEDYIQRLMEMSVENAAEGTDEVAPTDTKVTKPKNGKRKAIRCKYCRDYFESRPVLWEHYRTHIPKAKQFSCPLPDCRFVSDVKHHLEYHLRNHTGSKPYRCDECTYRCTTKGMLASHKKSHSPHVPYHCTCGFAVKYVHSLKQHCRNRGHPPANMIDEDGNPIPDVVIDIYGRRRGPRRKPDSGKKPTRPPNKQATHPPNKEATPPHQLPFPVPPMLSQAQMDLYMQKLLQINPYLFAAAFGATPPQEGVLDLSKTGASSLETPRKRRKVSRPAPRAARSPSPCTTMFSNVEALVQAPESPEKKRSVGCMEKCHFCDMSYGNPDLYRLHMSYHGSPNPFTCNLCKEECRDSVEFNSHIMRAAH